MRVVGYIRETPGPEAGDSAFAQSEAIRLWVARNGYQLVAVCQDAARSDESRDGFRALMEIARSDRADIVLIASLQSLSASKAIQEILISELRSLGVSVSSTIEADLDALGSGPSDPARMLIRDVLEQRREIRGQLSGGASTSEPAHPRIVPKPDSSPPREPREDRTDVLVELVERHPVAPA